MPTPSVLGLDIGGANLKAAHSTGSACSHPFQLWRTPGDLARALKNLLGQMPKSELLALTMTGELCDCFDTKRQGVRTILDAVEYVAESLPVRVWTTDGSFVCANEARAEYLKAASANWLALATFVGRFVPDGFAFLIDIGSTTTDIILLREGRPTPRGRTDTDRLRYGELVYTGVNRTPVCALLGKDGAAELFATTLDVYLLLGEIPEDPNDRSTADTRPATRDAAHARLARMKCADSEAFSMIETMALAQDLANRQSGLLRKAFRNQTDQSDSRPNAVVVSGSGEFLARRVLENVRTISLAEELGPAISQSACAYAVAMLANESLIEPK
jgi:probable H4MPT-linked C1 transfer pathway protein